ncbi:MAG: hypothetical protein IJM51_08330 [Clostridia bacterium]|nr:hypothetical protein [Clostridia bacterium]
MNATTVVENKENKTKTIDIVIPEKNKKSGNKNSLLIMTAVSLAIMFIAVGLIYYFIKSDPSIIHENDQTTKVVDDNSYVNPDSIQKLEHDDSNFSMKPAENSDVFIICGSVFMVVIAGAFIYVKVAESKEDD